MTTLVKSKTTSSTTTSTTKETEPGKLAGRKVGQEKDEASKKVKKAAQETIQKTGAHQEKKPAGKTEKPEQLLSLTQEELAELLAVDPTMDYLEVEVTDPAALAPLAGSKLTKLKVHFTAKEIKSALPQIATLEKLTLSGNIHDETLLSLAKLPLKSLSVNSGNGNEKLNAFTNKGLTALFQHPTLEVLRFNLDEKNSFSHDAMNQARGKTKIKTLIFEAPSHSARHTFTWYYTIGAIKSLEHLAWCGRIDGTEEYAPNVQFGLLSLMGKKGELASLRQVFLLAPCADHKKNPLDPMLKKESLENQLKAQQSQVHSNKFKVAALLPRTWQYGAMRQAGEKEFADNLEKLKLDLKQVPGLLATTQKNMAPFMENVVVSTNSKEFNTLLGE